MPAWIMYAKKLRLLSHKNIKTIHLSGCGLPLNRQGSGTLARNIKSHLLVNFNYTR